MITLTLRLKNRDTGRDGEVSTQWPRSTVRGCPPPHMHKKNLFVPCGYSGDGWGSTSRNTYHSVDSALLDQNKDDLYKQIPRFTPISYYSSSKDDLCYRRVSEIQL